MPVRTSTPAPYSVLSATSGPEIQIPYSLQLLTVLTSPSSTKPEPSSDSLSISIGLHNLVKLDLVETFWLGAAIQHGHEGMGTMVS